MQCTIKRFYGKSIISYISWLFVLSPYLALFIIVTIDGMNFLWDLPFAILISYLFYFTIGIGGIGYVSIGKRIYCPKDLTPRVRYIQGKIDIPIEKVIGIEFKRMDGNSDGLMQYRMWDYSYLVFHLDDDTTKALYLVKFSTNQYIQIQKEILKLKPDILILCSAEEFIKKFKR